MYDIVIIGAGPAGSSAALFAAKSGKKTLLVDNDKSVTKRALFWNYLGVMEMTGPELVETGKQQAIKYGAELVQDKVTNIVKKENGFVIETEDKGQFEANQIILTTGMLVDLAGQLGIETKPGTEPRVKTVISVDNSGKTSMEGVWAAGVCAGAGFHAIITAGDGAKVAVNVISELNGERYIDHDVLPAK
ncbi:NAD(P)/FAD-dependent oxidoreductase [Brevibacillus sp. BC25]|uniref:NAD(P)/FAD-dependent oxidoreductase n=1 Tax=Brevibacillus sp. BC25 TaxID=1144308 RepID=UPI0002710B4E|nr:NAD(P)/FAD-dependent oxidoreductase [Brevibacillus sp. BC25]EJL27685.1 thioredoxin reductase [Brevibacillus sp. BC25]